MGTRVCIEGGLARRRSARRPEDEPLYVDFFKHVTPEDLRLRFFAKVKDFSHAFISRLIQIDYSRAIAFAASTKKTGELMGVVRLHADANHETGEYAILLALGPEGPRAGLGAMQLDDRLCPL